MTQLSIIINPKDVRDIDAGIEELIAIKNRLLSHAAMQEALGLEYAGVVDISSGGLVPGYDGTMIESALDDLWPRLGQSLRNLMRAAAGFDQPYTTQDLAKALGSDIRTAKSWRANLGRSLNAVYKNHPHVPRFFEDHPQPGGGGRYSIHPRYRDLIEARDLNEPVSNGTLPQSD